MRTARKSKRKQRGAGCITLTERPPPMEIIAGVNGRPVADLEQFSREVKEKDLKQGLRLHIKSAQGSRFVYRKDGTPQPSGFRENG